MTYEEKLEKVISKLKEERKITRKGHKTKVTFNDGSFSRVRIGDICKILLKLRDDEKIVKILDALQPVDTVPTEQIITDKDDYEGVEIISVEIGEEYDDWFESYLMRHKTDLENLDYINMLRIYDVVSSINEQIQLTHKTTIQIHLIPSLIRFQTLFPADTTRTRDEYCENRLNSLLYLKEKNIIDSYSHGKEGWDTIISVSLRLSKFDEFYRKITDEYVKRNKENDKDEKSQTTITEIDKEASEEAVWSDDFRWEGNNFVFGEYGSIPLQSKDRKYLFKALTDKKGGWATISELKGNKDAGYVRSTIKQIEDRLPEKAQRHISIISTKDDDSVKKPNTGAYRIKVQQ